MAKTGGGKVAIVMGSQSDWPTMRLAAEILEELEVEHEARIVSAHRTPDRMSAFAKGAEGVASSTYHTFLVNICLQLLGTEVEEPERIVAFLLSQRSEDGGFREIRVSKRAGTNLTAAAVATLSMLDAMNEELTEGAIDFFCEMQNDEGGLLANTRIPIADLLSTFTGLVALGDLKAVSELDVLAMQRFVTSLESEDGGFIAAAWDEVRDVEYSFYGLGALALLHT